MICQHAAMRVEAPTLEGTAAVRDGRQLSFAEYGPPDGQPIVWMHGTPGARRQIPLEARAFAAAQGVRIIGIDRPGIGSSSPYLYDNVPGWTEDLRLLLDALGVDTFRLVGLSGGGPYVLAAGAAMPDRVLAAAVLGGVAPTGGPTRLRAG
ncbi:alpha/beta fold hydrolase [Nocardioides sp. B-3]|uniref:alpha/beta fold hydrolase n=1 Tax=Nocardioides sp. B-3 TaxID=2895565 RepID=UPI002153818B|nr:alpha/beta hydrolase [Nocardioides sp. B-3]UUZ58599.1 alpha/beta hydrolase [Nocardioides sp. B-3]